MNLLEMKSGNVVDAFLIRGIVKFPGKGVVFKNEYNKTMDYEPETDPFNQDALVKAATDRKIVPEGAAETVTAWFARPEPHVVHRTAILAGLWKVEPAREKLASLLTDPKTIPAIRDGATRGLTALGGVKTRDLFDKLFVESADLGLKSLMIDGLTAVGPQLAANRAVEFLATAEVGAAKPVLGAFLKNKQLPGVLAKELAGKSIPDLVAVEGIRMVSTRVGTWLITSTAVDEPINVNTAGPS